MKNKDLWQAVKWGLGIGLGLLTVRLVVEALSMAIPLAVDAIQGKASLPSDLTKKTTPPELGEPT